MKLIRADYIFIGSLLLLIGAHTTTNFMVWHMQGVAEQIQVAEDVIYQFEANPIAKFFLSLEQFKLIFSYVIAPGLLTGLYYYIRRKYNKEKILLEAYSISFFCFFLLDFTNDISIALSMFL